MASENHDLSTRRHAYSRAQMTRSMPEHPRYYGIDPRMPDHLRHHDKVIKPVIKQVIKAMHKPVPKPVPKPAPKPVPTTIPTSVAAPTTITAPSTTYASPEHKLDQALLKLNETRDKPLEIRKTVFRDLQRSLHPDKHEECAEAAKRAFQVFMGLQDAYLTRWKKQWSFKYQIPYFYNTETCESVWEIPLVGL